MNTAQVQDTMYKPPTYDKVKLQNAIQKHVPQSVWDELDKIPVFLYGSRSMLLREEAIKENREIADAFAKLSSRGIASTDYDFIMQDSAAVRAELKKRRFDEIKGSDMYNVDQNTAAVFTKKLKGGLFGKDTEIQVILKTNVELVKKTWKLIHTPFYYKNLWKSSPEFVMKNLDTQSRKQYITLQMNMLYDMAAA